MHDKFYTIIAIALYCTLLWFSTKHHKLQQQLTKCQSTVTKANKHLIGSAYYVCNDDGCKVHTKVIGDTPTKLNNKPDTKPKDDNGSN